ncbi:LEAF RUST 10 DISEASE-RESISTANCE LOCUS RECEPTOR-LIKE PROTEIN KINASE-like 2.5 [Hordeum vulgare subsp. vulgare]|uniref:Protein kinase domain-containing protein n=1 Tax=Hordeum vulgare subsp. vulgare TaxID=112509 RepID=M0WZ16_HORVV|nr:LEAF RUST 10 DISEASE-RESISTANCE LOCUS RECEPTOR-LIKE PROTEIN KINASE-like 2.5 [Hordeum vulgare subsp. vulgare]
MTNSVAFPRSVILLALAISSILSLLLSTTEAEGTLGRAVCPSFSCGHLQDIRHPFRLRGDPPSCGVREYELVCRDGQAIIHINTGRYFVTSISYSDSVFWVVDAKLDHGSCPIPERNQLPYFYGFDSANMILFLLYSGRWASFVSCSRMIKDNANYRPVACQSTNSSFVYVSTALRWAVHVEPSCRYLAMTPLGSSRLRVADVTSYDYEDVVKFMRKGFAVRFPFLPPDWTCSWIINTCLNNSRSDFHEQMSSLSIQNRISVIFAIDVRFLGCVRNNSKSDNRKLYWAVLVVVSAISIMKLIIVFAVLSRLVFAPLSILIFLAHKYWKTKISIDAVERFLQMQLALGPTRFAYTDITAITSHFKEKLGQGGYGSVYKGVLPGDVHVAIKMLVSSMSNGEEFISEVSSIGSIHHVNVVRLVGFCSEEMRRALVYEYMPHGSLEKYIFSPEKSFSWDKLNQIALGIARGIDYLHRGCDMQILHFDIKPHNILLDSDFTPKIADFGLAKLYPRDNSFLPVSAARGTVGYIAPEMVSRSFGAISSKSDVYSFGMLLLEMAGGRRNVDPRASRSQTYYPAWVYNQLSRQEVGVEISEAVVGIHQVERKLCVVALWCIQMKPDDRPAMSEVLDMLEAGIDGLEMPPEPFFCGDEYAPAADSSILLLSEISTISE